MDVLCDTDHCSRSRDVTFWFYWEKFFTKTGKISNCEKITFFCGLARKSHSGGLIILDLLYTLWTSGGNAGSIETWNFFLVIFEVCRGHLAGTPALLKQNLQSGSPHTKNRGHLAGTPALLKLQAVSSYHTLLLLWTSGGNAGSIETFFIWILYNWYCSSGHLAGTPALLKLFWSLISIREPISSGHLAGTPALLKLLLSGNLWLWYWTVDIWRERRLYWNRSFFKQNLNALFVDIWRERRLYWNHLWICFKELFCSCGHLAGTPALLKQLNITHRRS